MSPLMVAVRENKLVIAERLLDLGANINDRANVSILILYMYGPQGKNKRPGQYEYTYTVHVWTSGQIKTAGPI